MPGLQDLKGLGGGGAAEIQDNYGSTDNDDSITPEEAEQLLRSGSAKLLVVPPPPPKVAPKHEPIVEVETPAPSARASARTNRSLGASSRRGSQGTRADELQAAPTLGSHTSAFQPLSAGRPAEAQSDSSKMKLDPLPGSVEPSALTESLKAYNANATHQALKPLMGAPRLDGHQGTKSESPARSTEGSWSPVNGRDTLLSPEPNGTPDLKATPKGLRTLGDAPSMKSPNGSIAAPIPLSGASSDRDNLSDAPKSSNRGPLKTPTSSRASMPHTPHTPVGKLKLPGAMSPVVDEHEEGTVGADLSKETIAGVAEQTIKRLRKQATGLTNERLTHFKDALDLPTEELVSALTKQLSDKKLSEPLYRQLSRTKTIAKNMVTEKEKTPEKKPVKKAFSGKDFLRAATVEKNVGMMACGKLLFDKSRQHWPSLFFKLPTIDKGGNAHLMRFIAERVWHLERPDVLITVTGGADDFDLPLDQKDTLLQGLMSVAKHMKAWIVTGGTDAGIMKYVGEAREKYAAHVPLLGVVSWGVVKGRHQFTDAENHDKYDTDLIHYDKAAAAHEYEAEKSINECYCNELNGCSVCAKKWFPAVKLNHNHTHFFLVDDQLAQGSFGAEIDTRAAFEACVSGSENNIQNIVELVKASPTLVRQNTIADGNPMQSGTTINLKDEKVNTDNIHGILDIGQEIPSVCVCVQGGPGSVSTVLSTAQSSTPVFLVKGSGKAADLIADMVLHKILHEEEHVEIEARAPDPIILEIVKKAEEYEAEMGIKIPQLPVGSFKNKKPGEEGRDPKKSRVRRRENKPAMYLISIKVLREVITHLEMEATKSKSGKGSMDRATINTLLNQTPLPPKEDAEKKERRRQLQDELVEVLFQGYEIYYGTSPKSRRECANIFRNAMKAASTDMCWAYDVGYEAPESLDFFGSLLRCFINGMGHEDNPVISVRDDKKVIQTQVLLQKLLMAIRWNRYDVLKHTMDSTRLPRISEPFIDAVNLALPLALQLNHVDHAKLLIAYGASLDQYLYPLDGDVSGTMAVDRRWQYLLSACRVDMRLHHMMLLMQETRGKQSTQLMSSSTLKTLTPAERMSDRLERVYRLLLGDAFQYELGIRGPELDLMLWAGVMNRPKMAKFFWSRAGQPVLNALTMCMLFRRLAARPDVTQVIMKHMLESAHEFEGLALGVQSIAMDEEMTMALDALENPSVIWDDMRLLDVAVHGFCEDFIEKCCRESLDRRFAGDLLPYGQRIGPVKGLKKSCAICVFSLGFAAPFILRYQAPPKASTVRFPTQRRRVPMGYPFDYESNVILNTDIKKDQLHWGSKELIDRLNDEGTRAVETMNNDDLNEMWSPTFTYWERFRLFWSSPVVIFTANGIVQVFALLLFTDWIVRGYEGIKFTPLDYVFAVYFGASILLECIEFFLTGWDYLGSFWNLLDVGAAALFFAGFRMKLICQDEPCDETLGRSSLPMKKMDKLFYSACLGLIWARFLRIFTANKAIGPLVIMVRKMGQDLLKFGLVWTVMWIAFAITLNGSVDGNPACEGDWNTYECEEWWFFIRTFFQAMGEPLLVEHRTDASVIILVFVFIIMNVILLNLLIAIMSNTYLDVQQQSNRRFLMDLYAVSEDYSKIALAMPLPFNVLFLIVDVVLYIWYTIDGTLDKLYPDHTFRDRLQKHMAQNSTQINERLERAYDLEGTGNTESRASQKAKGQEAYYQSRTDAFMENAKSTYVKRRWKEFSFGVQEEQRDSYVQTTK